MLFRSAVNAIQEILWYHNDKPTLNKEWSSDTLLAIEQVMLAFKPKEQPVKPRLHLTKLTVRILNPEGRELTHKEIAERLLNHLMCVEKGIPKSKDFALDTIYDHEVLDPNEEGAVFADMGYPVNFFDE